MSTAPERGIAPEILLTHVENTAPWIRAGRAPPSPYHSVLEAAFQGKAQFDHYEYFELCLSAHYATVATFVPTDVDNQIRRHLWHGSLPAEVSRRMAELVLRSLEWDFRPVTARYQEAPGNGYVCGHQGEWFSVAVGAYAAHRESDPALTERILARLVKEVKAEAALYSALRKAKDGTGLLRACTAIAHNLGDLDRVIDQWELPAEDPLRRRVYKLGHEGSAAAAEISGVLPEERRLLVEAGNLNKAFMASENHRHYPLRKPKGLRRGLELLLPLGPFFDNWGETVGHSRLLEDRDRLEVAEALLEGFQKLSSPKVPLYGYARALAGLKRSCARVLDELPSSKRKQLEKGTLAELMRGDARALEAAWAKKALVFLKL